MTRRVYLPSPDPVWTIDTVADAVIAGLAWLALLVVGLAGWSVTP